MNHPVSWLASPRQTRAVLDEFGLATKHRLGQNFLVSDDVIARILALAAVGEDDVVLEVGPGIGTLTVALLPRAAAVVAVEADRTLAPVLAETCGRDSDRFALVLGDALRVGADELAAAVERLGISGMPVGVPLAGDGDDVGGDLSKGSQAPGPLPTMLVSNLPYQVAATLILKVFAELPSVRRLVVMVQAEVADRISAAPGTKAYGAYTAKLALYGQVTGRFEVGPGNFMPPPHVESAVVRIDRWAAAGADGAPGLATDSDQLMARTGEPKVGEGESVASGDGTLGIPGGGSLSPEDIARTSEVIDAAFAQRRKTIRNSMAARGFDKAALDAAFAATGITPTCRAETLAPADFVHLAAALEGVSL